MKRTELERRDRELKKAKKKEDSMSKKTGKEGASVAEYTEQLHKLFFFDEEKIYNINQSTEIMELAVEMQLNLEEKELENAIRKAIRMTKVKAKKQAFDEVKALLS